LSRCPCNDDYDFFCYFWDQILSPLIDIFFIYFTVLCVESIYKIKDREREKNGEENNCTTFTWIMNTIFLPFHLCNKLYNCTIVIKFVIKSLAIFFILQFLSVCSRSVFFTHDNKYEWRWKQNKLCSII